LIPFFPFFHFKKKEYLSEKKARMCDINTFFFLGFVFGLIGCTVALFKYPVHVPANHCAFIRKKGKYFRLREGWHFIGFIHPLVEYSCSYHEQTKESTFENPSFEWVHIKTHSIPLTNQVLVVPPVPVFTKSKYNLDFNCTLHYLITRQILAADNYDGLHHLLQARIASSSLVVISNYDHDELEKNAIEIESKIIALVRDFASGLGVECIGLPISGFFLCKSDAKLIKEKKLDEQNEKSRVVRLNNDLINRKGILAAVRDED
jgi:hypothetical protein